jgi:hypothetical protein
MILFYGMGGGLGHLTRIQAVITQFKISDYILVSANPLAHHLFTADHLAYVPSENKSVEDYVSALQAIIQNINISEIYIDTFPLGILGELSWLSATNIKLHYIARRLIWKNYAPLISTFLFYEKVHQIEPLESPHLSYVREHSKEVVLTDIQYSPPVPSRVTHIAQQFPAPLWVIVHSFHQEELESLMRYAEDQARIEKINPALLVITDQPLAHCPYPVRFDYPAADWFPLANRIFTGGGFNAMQQMALYRDKHKPLPFPRRFDDQFWRTGIYV